MCWHYNYLDFFYVLRAKDHVLLMKMRNVHIMFRRKSLVPAKQNSRMVTDHIKICIFSRTVEFDNYAELKKISMALYWGVKICHWNAFVYGNTNCSWNIIIGLIAHKDRNWEVQCG